MTADRQSTARSINGSCPTHTVSLQSPQGRSTSCASEELQCSPVHAGAADKGPRSADDGQFGRIGTRTRRAGEDILRYSSRPCRPVLKHHAAKQLLSNIQKPAPM